MGYNQDFIDQCLVNHPIIGDRLKPSLYNYGEVINHSRFSFVFSTERMLSLYTAHNIDGESLIPTGTILRKDRFRSDPKIPKDIQLKNDQGYKNNPWDRGHLVKRTSMHWGNDLDIAFIADQETFFWTNISPQHENLHDTAWGSIEDWVLELADSADKRLCIFTGPVFSFDDPIIPNQDNKIAKIPAGFWKIIVLKKNQKLTSAGFLVWQRDYDKDLPESFSPVLEQVRITTIEYLTGLLFTDLRSTDTLLYSDSTPQTEISSINPAENLSPTNSLRMRPINKSLVTNKFDLLIN